MSAADRVGGALPCRLASPGLQAVGDAAHLGEEPLPRGAVVDMLRLARLLIAVEPIENLEVGRDRLKVAGVDRLGGEGLRALEPEELKQGMIRGRIDRLPLQGV